MRLLVVEDDPTIGEALRQGFEESGFQVVRVADGQQGLAVALGEQFDVILLDLLLPSLPGQEILRRLRAEGHRTPVILLTALGGVEERVEGLRAGADDYVVKPFAFAELAARVEAVCRRAGSRPSTTFTLGDLHLDLGNRRVEAAGTEVALTPTEFSILELLLRHAGQVVTRQMLCEHIWDTAWEGATNVVEVHINRLRGKLERAGSGERIHTIRGRGYAIRAS